MRPFSNQSSAVFFHAAAADAMFVARRAYAGGVVLRQDWFHCEDCGSPGVSIPQLLTACSIVSCANCGRTIGSWAEYRRHIDQALRAEQARRASPLVVADPIGVA
jgi:DNA-directed RNA polymerase subunit N (RpoN/RPB10)